MISAMPRHKKSPDPKPHISAPEAPKEKPKEKKLNIPLLEAKLSALMLSRNPSENIATKLGKKADPKLQQHINAIVAAIDDLDTFGEQYRYLAALRARGQLTSQLHSAFVGSILNLREQVKEDRDHELAVRRYLRRAEYLLHTAVNPQSIPSDRVDALRKQLRSDSAYKKVRNTLTDELISELVGASGKPKGQSRASELAEVAGILFGDDQRNFLQAFGSAYTVARSHDIPVSETLKAKPTFANMVDYLRNALSQVLTEERKKQAFGDSSDYSPQKLSQLEEQLRSIERMTLKLQQDDDAEIAVTRESFAQQRQVRSSYAAMPAMRELREFGVQEFSQTPQEAAEMSKKFIAELHTELKSQYTQLSQLSSIVSVEAAALLHDIKVNRAVITNLELELAVGTSVESEQLAISDSESQPLAETRYHGLHNQLRIKDLQAEIEDYQDELRSADNKDRGRLQAYIASRQDRLNGYILLEKVINAQEELAQLRAQLEYVDPLNRRPIQDAIERLNARVNALKAEHEDHMKQRETREAAREERERAKHKKK